MSQTPTKDTAATLHQAIAALRASGADRFKPVRFHYIETLASQSLQRQGAVAEFVANKALTALAAYEAELCAQSAAAAGIAEQLAARCPDMGSQAQVLLADHDFRGLRRLAKRRERSPVGPALTALVDRLDQAAPVDPQAQVAIGDILRNHEADTVRSVTSGVADVKLPEGGAELKAAHYFRDALARQRADALVSHEAETAPTDSGPLNPQKLAIRSLEAMRDLSPAYLGRFISYVDTLFWLERTGDGTRQ